MLQDVTLTDKNPRDYTEIIGDKEATTLEKMARPLKGKKLLHISATSFGGGVSEYLHSLVPLQNSVGINANWKVLLGESDFFLVTKCFHNALQGEKLKLNKQMKKTYLALNKSCSENLVDDYDFIVVHDPQPAAIKRFYPSSKAKWIWRCHIDTSNPNPDVWAFLRPYIEEYDAAIFTLKEFVPKDLSIPEIHLIQPAIDPLNLKNIRLPDGQCRQIIKTFGFDPNQPILLQVSRFDIWKDPFGVIDVYRQVKEQFTNLHLALVGSMATDDPEGWEYFSRVVNYAEGDENISTLVNLGDIEVNAFQRAANVVIQKSIREAFGLVVSEALWKAKPVVAGKVGGIPLQIENNKSGFLVEKLEQYANRVITLLNEPDLAKKLGRNGHQHVKKNFLVTRVLKDYLKILNQ